MKLLTFFCLMINFCLAQSEIEFDSEKRVLSIQISENCLFNSQYSLIYTDDYTYFISKERDFIYFLSEFELYGNNPFEYEICILVFECPDGVFKCNETIKIPSKTPLEISLEESKLVISENHTNLILDLKNVSSEEIVKFKEQVIRKFN